MATPSLGGLSGKARRVHYRGHADRQFAERLIADYLEPDGPRRQRAHHAPIRGRREFMPTVFAELNMTDSVKESQLELAWHRDRRQGIDGGRAADRRVVWSTGDGATDADQAVALIKVPSSGGAPMRIEHNNTTEPETRMNTTPAPDIESTGDASERSSGTRVLRIPRRSRARMPIGWSQVPMARPGARLSIRGFATGCAIGGMAAAVVLTVLRVALG